MRIFITGMTGFLGYELGVKLHEKGHTIGTLVRNVATSDRPIASNTESMIRGEKLKGISFYQPQSELVKHQQTLEDYFKAHPPATIKEAMEKIEKITGLKRSEKPVTKFINKLGLKRRKVGMVPSKADPEKQETFKKNSWNPGSRKPRPEKGPSFLWMLRTLFQPPSWGIFGAKRGCGSRPLPAASGSTCLERSTRSITS